MDNATLSSKLDLCQGQHARSVARLSTRPTAPTVVSVLQNMRGRTVKHAENRRAHINGNIAGSGWQNTRRNVLSTLDKRSTECRRTSSRNGSRFKTADVPSVGSCSSKVAAQSILPSIMSRTRTHQSSVVFFVNDVTCSSDKRITTSTFSLRPCSIFAGVWWNGRHGVLKARSASVRVRIPPLPLLYT